MWTIALCVFTALVALVFLIPALMPSKYVIEKSIRVDAAPEKCFDKIVNLNNYAAWNPWSQMEPDAVKKIEGTPGTPGHYYAWQGHKTGAGVLTVKKVDPSKSAELELEFFRPWKAVGLDSWTFEYVAGQTKITWKNIGPLQYPVVRLMGPMIKKNLEKQFEAGLENLKKLCENDAM